VRVRRYLIVLAGVGVLAAGCGTVHAGQARSSAPDVLAAAVSGTSTQTARIAITESVQSTGMSISFTETGEFDFANSRGMLTMSAPFGMTELLLPPKVYLKISGDGGGSLPHGKTWIEIDAGSVDSLSTMFSVESPGDLLAWLTAVAGSERIVGATTIRGVPVTEYQVNIDPAKMAAKASGQERASLSQFAKSFGNGSIPVDVWVDNHDLLRQMRLSLRGPGQAGAANSALVVSIDFYDFGVPVRVSAPPAAQVASTGQSVFSIAGLGSASAAASAMPVGSYVPGASGSAAASAPPVPPTVVSPLPTPTMIASPVP
jgi:hypothetical protein